MADQTLSKPGDPLYPDGSRFFPALAEVLIVGLLFVFVAHLFVNAVDLTRFIPEDFSATERTIGAGFLAGAIIQITLVIGLAVMSKDMRRAFGACFKFGNLPAWGAALIALGIHVATLTLFFIKDPTLIIEPSFRNLLLSTVPAFDGWSQEVMFRGYVIFRLARSGAPAFVQILLSAFLFSAIHVGYMGADLASMIWPMFGTAVLGGFFAWSVRLGGGALMPVVFAHTALIIIIQPWLALS